MARHSIEFLRYLMGLRGPRTTLTPSESAALRALAAGRACAAEIGVYEGATSAVLAEAVSAEGTLYLVDPYFREVRLERWLGLSFTEHVARRSTRPWRGRVRFVRETSLEGAQSLPADLLFDLVFIDADHSYEAVRQDFLAWAPRLAPEGVLAFHDSRCCAARPDLSPATGPVRLMDELRRGQHGAWRIVAEADSLTAVARESGKPKDSGGAG